MKKFISSILILGFTVVPMSYAAFAQEETEILSEVQTETETIQEGMSTKEQESLDTQEDNDIDKQSGDLKEDEDTQIYSEKIQYEIVPEATQQNNAQEKEVFEDVQADDGSESFQISPETRNKLKKVAAVLPLFVAKKCVELIFNYITKIRPGKMENEFNECSKATVEICWSTIKNDVSPGEAWSEYNNCKTLAKNDCFNEYTLMKNAKRLGFVVKVVNFLFDTYNIVNSKNFR